MDENKQAEAVKVPTASLGMDIIVEEWKKAGSNREKYTTDFPQLDSIVDGIPLTHEKGTPYVGDTTIAGLVRSIPRESIQQMPVFAAVINGSKKTEHAAVSSFFLRKGVFNEDSFGIGILSTLQLAGEEALKHGFAPLMCAAGAMYSEFGTTMRLMHYDDVSPEPGIQFSNEGGYFYVEATLPKSRVTKIRNAALKNPNTSWNVQKLTELLALEPEAKSYDNNQSAARQTPGGTPVPGYTFVTRYEVGRGGEFVTFCPQLSEDPLRVLTNRSKFGYPRVQFLVIDPAPLSPYGVSRVRLASPNQNLMNAYYQNVAAMLILNSKPPIMVRGTFAKPVQLRKGEVWRTKDQNATVELKELSNSTLQTFVPMAQQFAAQIQNMMGSPTGTVNGGTNAFGFSKTGPGVRMQENFQNKSSNQITNIFENFLRQYGLVALDTMLSEQTTDKVLNPETGEMEYRPNEETIILDDEAAAAVNRAAQARFVPSPEAPEFVPVVGEDNEFIIDWNQFYDAIKTMAIEIELSIGKDELDEKKRADIQDTLVTMTQNADPNDVNKQAKISELEDRLIEKAVPESSRMDSAPVMPPSPMGAPAPMQ